MSPDEHFLAECDMWKTVPTVDLLSALLYELTREQLRSPNLYDQRFSILLPPDIKAPYRLLTAEAKQAIDGFFWMVAGKKWDDLYRNVSKAEILWDIQNWLSLGRSTAKKSGRGSCPALFRQNLKYLGAFRVLQRYSWNRIPVELSFYTNQREWLKAKQAAKKLLENYPIWWLALCGPHCLRRYVLKSTP